MSEKEEQSELSPKKIKALLADNQLSLATEQLLEYSLEHGLTDLHNQVVIQSGKLKQYQKERTLGTVGYNELTRTRINLNLSLLEITDQLPKQDTASKKKKITGISERKFKRQIFQWLLFGKIFLFIYIFTVWESGGLTFDAFTGTLSIIFPVFATYLSLIYQNILSNRHKHKVDAQLQINRTLQYSAYLFFSLYYIGIILIVYLQAIGKIPNVTEKRGDTEFKTFNNYYALLAFVETFIGVYIGKLIFSLFKKEA